jgi:5-formyltetrahydrofolate cyclo-ligase
MMVSKGALRARMKRDRNALSMIEAAELSARIAERVLAVPEFIRANRVFCYANAFGEVDTRGLMREIIYSGRELYLPRVKRGVKMDAARLNSIDDLRTGPYGIDEPQGDESIKPGCLEVLLIPGVAFDRRGGRLGMGAGYFDRFLLLCRGLKIGLSYDFQIIDRVPVNARDMRMDMVITETHIYDCREEWM